MMGPTRVEHWIAGAAALLRRSPILAGAAGLLAVSVVVAISYSYAIGRGPPEAQSAERVGAALYRGGDYARAADALRAAFRDNPTEELRLDLARALYGAGDFAGVLETLAAESDAPAHALLRAEALLGLERYDEARAAAASLGAVYEGRFALVAARAHYAQGRADLANANLANALRGDADTLADAWLFRTRMELDGGALDKARAALARARETGAGARAVDSLNVELSIREGDLAEARRRLEASSRPKRRWFFDSPPAIGRDVETQRLLALVEAAGGDYANAARRLRSIDSAMMGDLHGRVLLAIVKYGAGDAAQAEGHLLDAVRFAPEDPVALDALAAFYSAEGRAPAALDAARRLEKASPALGRMRLILEFERRGAIDRAIAVAREGAATPAPPFSSATLFGDASAPAARDQAARARLEAALAAGAALVAGDAAQAAAAAERLGAYGEDTLALALLGELSIFLGDDAAARRALAAAAQRSPQSEVVGEALVRLDVRAGDFESAIGRMKGLVAAQEEGAGAPAVRERIALARLLDAAGRRADAADALAPASEKLHGAGAATFYATLLDESDRDEALQSFASELQRAAPSALSTVEVLTLASRHEDAALAARRAAIADPADRARLQSYAAIMDRLGRGEEAGIFLAAVARIDPASEKGAPAEDYISDTLIAARALYASQPGDAAAALAYAERLNGAGDSRLGERVRREACYWGARAACAPSSVRGI